MDNVLILSALNLRNFRNVKVGEYCVSKADASARESGITAHVSEMQITRKKGQLRTGANKHESISNESLKRAKRQYGRKWSCTLGDRKGQ